MRRTPSFSRLFDRGPAASDAALQEVIARRDRRRVQRLRRVGVGAVVVVVAGAAVSVTTVRDQNRFSTAIDSPKIATPAAAEPDVAGGEQRYVEGGPLSEES